MLACIAISSSTICSSGWIPFPCNSDEASAMTMTTSLKLHRICKLTVSLRLRAVQPSLLKSSRTDDAGSHCYQQLYNLLLWVNPIPL